MRLPRVGASLRVKKRKSKAKSPWQCIMCGSVAEPESTGERLRPSRDPSPSMVCRCRSCGHRNTMDNFLSVRSYYAWR